MNEKSAKIAAKWWADQLRKPAKLDNGDDSEAGFMTLMLSTMLQSRERSNISSEMIDRFEQEIFNEVMQRDVKWMTIDVDYHPDLLLCQAAQKANLPLGATTLPWKTIMWIRDNGEVKVACGYRAEPEILLEAFLPESTK